MRGSRLAAGGENILQTIRAKRAEAEARGIKLTDLSIGEPKGAALLSARKAAAEAVMSEEEAMHAYQYNASPGVPNFAPRFIRAHVNRELGGHEVDYLPIPGIKPILGTGAAVVWLLGTDGGSGDYDGPGLSDTGRLVRNLRPRGAVCSAYQPAERVPLHYGGHCQRTNLIMTNYPHNPSGQVASRRWLEELCAYCNEHDIRLFTTRRMWC